MYPCFFMYIVNRIETKTYRTLISVQITYSTLHNTKTLPSLKLHEILIFSV